MIMELQVAIQPTTNLRKVLDSSPETCKHFQHVGINCKSNNNYQLFGIETFFKSLPFIDS